MSTSQYLLNLGLLVWILWANLGTRAVTRTRLLLPVAVVAGVGAGYLQNVPTLGNDVTLEVVLATAGVLLGIVSGLLVGVRRDGERLVMRAGAGYAALWIAVVGGRIAFAYGADHWFGPQIARFSRQHLITGSDAWTAAFVLMALAMVLTRVVVTGVRVLRTSRAAQHAPAAA
jgi:hypothetical protein